MDSPLLKIRRLTFLLVLSGAGNIALIAFFVHSIISEKPPIPYCELKPATQEQQQAPVAFEHTNSEVIRLFKTFSLQQLVSKLTNENLVENGYTQRDLALGCLVAFHQFNLSKSLAGQAPPSQQRSIDGIVIYPGLSTAQYQSITDYVRTERWPLTSEGLFLELKKRGQTESSLCDAFYLTPEFLNVEMLFNRSEIPVAKSELLTVILDGEWQMLAQFADQQRQVQDLSQDRRRRFLLDYIEKDSKQANLLFLKADAAFAAKKLDDAQVLKMLKLISEWSPCVKEFSLTLLTNPRSDQIWEATARKLYELAGEPLPEKFHHHAALARFMPKNSVLAAAPTTAPSKPTPVPVQKIKPPATAQKQPAPKKIAEQPKNQKKTKARPAKIYIVKEGDSLWKIAKRYNVKINDIVTYNGLTTDFLVPGTTLRIP